MIDLHLHTTASDGLLSPAELVDAVASVGLRTIAVTDHDTTAAIREVAAIAAPRGITVIPGIEITAVHRGRDVHVLGYFIDIDRPAFAEFLTRQRADRRRRIDEMTSRLAALNVPVARPLPGESNDGALALGRPLIARALVEAGHCDSIADAFDRFLSEGRPAFVPRLGATPADVVRHIADAGGIASLAHPGKSAPADLVDAMIADGLPAIEVFHPDHAADDVARYLELASRHRLLATGGSDFHGAASGRESFLGRVTLPREHFDALATRAARGRPS